MRRVKRDKRRVAVAPIGNHVQECSVGVLVRFHGVEVGHDAARIGKADAKADSAFTGNAVDGDDAECALDLRDDDERLPFRRRIGSARARRKPPADQPVG